MNGETTANSLYSDSVTKTPPAVGSIFIIVPKPDGTVLSVTREKLATSTSYAFVENVAIVTISGGAVLVIGNVTSLEAVFHVGLGPPEPPAVPY